MTPAERLAHVHALLAGVDPVRLCWAPSSAVGLPFCGGAVTWTEGVGRSWCSACSRCGATGRAASGEASDIVRQFGRSARECQDVVSENPLDSEI